jgi:predicted nucleotidyltransferase
MATSARIILTELRCDQVIVVVPETMIEPPELKVKIIRVDQLKKQISLRQHT